MKGMLAQFKMFFIFIIDLVVAYGALFLMLFSRYGSANLGGEWSAHFVPFSIIIFIFFLVFYIFNLYSFRFNRNTTEFVSSFVKSLVISFGISVLVFYIFGDFFKLTPKTNLVLYTLIFGAIDFYLRILIKRYFVRNGIARKIIIVTKEENALLKEIAHNQNIGYEIVAKIDELDVEKIVNLAPDLIIINAIEGHDFNKIYPIKKKGIFVYTANSFYEEIFQKVPTEKIDKNVVVDYLSKNKTVFNFIKRILDIFLSLFLLIVSAPISLILSILIKFTSRGPVLFNHTRVSLNDGEFTIYKFRSMYLGSEKDGAVWTEDVNADPRITPIGRFMRKTHLDEIPQLINVLRGDISFVGPRPERPEFTSALGREILYYDLRHSVKAGLTGWAQVNYKYGASVDDAREKLKYDFYYIKNRNTFFDLLIILKTIAMFFSY